MKTKNIRRIITIVLNIFFIPNLTWSTSNPWPMQLNIDPTNIDYHNPNKPNALICRSTDSGHWEGYDPYWGVSTKVWIDPNKEGSYQFPVAEWRQHIHSDVLVCDVATTPYPGGLHSFSCSIKDKKPINLAKDIVSGKCHASYFTS